MDVKRRQFMGASAAGFAGALAMSPDSARAAQPTSMLGRDATQYGVRPGSPDDQTKILQRAIDEAARAQVPLALPPGIYRTGLLRLQGGTQLIGVRGATKFVFNGGASMLQGEGAGGIGLSGITFDGGGIPLPTRRGLIHCSGGRDIRITECGNPVNFVISESGAKRGALLQHRQPGKTGLIDFENETLEQHGFLIGRKAVFGIVVRAVQRMARRRATIGGAHVRNRES